MLDGAGDGLTGLIASFRDGQVTVLRKLKEMGPAALYLLCTEIIGFSQFDEYKVMGSRRTADQALPQPFRRAATSCCDGRSTCGCRWIASSGLYRDVYRAAAKRRGVLAEHQDLAAAAAGGASKRICPARHLGHFAQETGIGRLCLAGGSRTTAR